ncbi:UPF0496 protein 1-like [Elaeis guineensis]|uniref:UPF0496 protein 1-like n=1 Tax=Elaeis guineensis var. tenera TaxID=51953 RepID=A0A6I9QJY6_ELAGV|nr:UPF0496 protein 1-like [Elaeis guineensis]
MGGCLRSKPAVHGMDDTDDNTEQRYISELNAYYEEACRLDPKIQTFNLTLQRRTSRVLSSLAGDAAALRSLSFNSLREATDGLLAVNHDAFAVVLDLKDDISSNPDLLFFVKEFFKNSVETLKFFAALKQCLHRAHEAESIVNSAIQLFDGKEFSKSLEKLRDFRALGDPFTSSFIDELRSVCEHQRSTLVSLHGKKEEIDKKLGCVKAWRKVWSVAYAATFAAVLICSVVLAAVAVPPAATAAAAAASTAMGSIGAWFDALWENCEGVLEGEVEVIGMVRKETFFAIQELDGMRVAVEKLEAMVGSMARETEFGMREEEEVAVRVAVEGMRKKLGEFGRSLVELENEVDRCSGEVGKASAAVLQTITGGSEGSSG